MTALVVSAVLLATVQQTTFTADDTRAAITQAAEAHGVSERFLDCVVRAESTYNPYAVGAAGERGAVQLHPAGRLQDFLARGYTSSWDPYQAVDYLAGEIVAGRASGTDGWYRSYRMCA